MPNTTNTDYKNMTIPELALAVLRARTPVPPPENVNAMTASFITEHSKYESTKRYDVECIVESAVRGTDGLAAHCFKQGSFPWKVNESYIKDIHEGGIIIAPSASVAILAETMGLWNREAQAIGEHEKLLVIPPEAEQYEPEAVEELRQRCGVLFDFSDGQASGENDEESICGNSGSCGTITFCETGWKGKLYRYLYAIDNETETVFQSIGRMRDADRFYDTGEVLAYSTCPKCGGELHRFVKHPKSEGFWHVGCASECGWMPSHMMTDTELGEVLMRVGDGAADEQEMRVWEYCAK